MALTHWGRDKMDALFQTTFSNGFSWMKMYEFRLKISLKFVPKGLINNIPSLVHIMAWRRPGDKPLSEPMVVCLPTHICVTRPQWVNVQSKARSGYSLQLMGNVTDFMWPMCGPRADLSFKQRFTHTYLCVSVIIYIFLAVWGDKFQT